MRIKLELIVARAVMRDFPTLLRHVILINTFL